MRSFKYVVALLALTLSSSNVSAQIVTLPQVNNAGGAKVPAVGVVSIDSSGLEKGTSGNPIIVFSTGPTALTATSSALTGSVTDTIAHTYGPFTPQLARAIWATLVGTAASGTAQLLRSTDGGTTKAGLTAGGEAWASWSFAASTGAIVNEQLVTETDAAATYYLAVTLTAGSLTYRIAQ